MKTVKVTNANTNDHGELFSEFIQGHYYSDAMKCTVLIMTGNTFFPVKESWNDIKKEIDNVEQQN